MKVRTIIESIFEAVDKVCPQVTKNLKMNTINRNKAIKADHIQYGPVNLSDDAYYVRLAKHWNSTPEKVKNSSCMKVKVDFLEKALHEKDAEIASLREQNMELSRQLQQHKEKCAACPSMVL